MLVDFEETPLQIKFLVVSFIFPRILVAGMVQLVAETVVDLAGLVVC